MEKQNNKKHPLKLLIKITISAIALYLVYRKIDVPKMLLVLKSANILWLILAFVLFNSSQVVSAKRLQIFFEAIQIRFKYSYNLILYYLGMFYNLFLPGGIGGDGYKVYLLNKVYKKPVKSLVGTLLHDRINGLIGLLSLMAFLLIIKIPSGYSLYANLIIIGISAGLIAYYFTVKIFFNGYLKIITPTFLLSLIIQALQLAAAFCLFLGLGLSNNYLLYLQLFLISSVVSVIPITIGGIGARELVFVYGSTMFNIDENLAVAFSLLFFLTTAISALLGAFIDVDNMKGNLQSSVSIR